MAKINQIVSKLEKLYEKRAALDKIILITQKKLADEVKDAEKPVSKSRKNDKAKKPFIKAAAKK